MITDDEYLERIVKGITATTMADADVQWNVKLGGRQFDVVARFKAGAHSFLVAIEVRNKKRKASASEVEAFVTKARDANADKMVFVTAAGFQSGAIKVARRHGVELFQVRLSSGDDLGDDRSFTLLRRKRSDPADIKVLSPPFVAKKSDFTIERGSPTITNCVEGCRLHYVGGKEIDVPDEPTQMEYYLKKTRLADGRSLHDLVGSSAGEPVALGSCYARRIELTPPSRVSPPDEFFYPAGDVDCVTIRVRAIETIPIRVELTAAKGDARPGEVFVDTNMFPAKVEYLNVLTGEKLIFDTATLPLGDEKLRPGIFYFAMNPLRYYFCKASSGGRTTMVLVESFQGGDLVRATITHEDRWNKGHFLRVSDPKILERLRLRLDDYNRLETEEKP